MRVDGPMISRVLASTVGACALAYGFAACCAQWLPIDAADAALIAALTSFVVLVASVPWIFSRRTAWHCWRAVAWTVPLLLAGFGPRLWGLMA